MKTFVPNCIKGLVILSGLVLATSLLFAQSVRPGLLSDGLKFDNPQLVSGNDLSVGSVYLFTAVTTDIDATVRIDSLVNGATVHKIDDNSSGVGYTNALQPMVKTGNSTGRSYAVFTVSFFKSGTSVPASVSEMNATALDIDGNINLKEFAGIDMGAGAVAKYMGTTTDLSLARNYGTNFMGENTTGVERNSIDTSALSNMYTVSNTHIASFRITYGAVTTVPSSSVRQYSMYMKGFIYPDQVTLPLDLISFTTVLQQQLVKLTWVTENEKNVSHFMVERSTNGKDFSDAALVFAYGNTDSRKVYTFSDNISSFNNGILYYRLHWFDNDGSGKFSETRIIRLSGNALAQGLSAFPNPAVQDLRVTLPAAWQGQQVLLQLYNASGQLVLSEQRASASQTETIGLGRFRQGIYLLRATSGQESLQQQVVKK